MKRSLQFKRPFAAMRPTALVLALLMGGAMSAWAQASGEISDAERAKRDANKVFSFIKFHAVKPAAAPAPAPAPAVAPAAVATAAAAGFDEADPSTWGNPSRNDPCPCGSGEKFKHCHGRLA